MSTTKEQLHSERLHRYTTALRKGKPDRVPIRPFVAEFCAKYAGFTCQEVTHDIDLAFSAVRKTAADFDWDAVVGNMVYVWTGLTQAIGLRYYAVPGIDVPPQTGFQYREPSEEHAFMKADEYDALIDDPTGFLYNTWLPRVCPQVAAPGKPNTYHNNLSFVKGGMAMLSYFNAFGTQAQLLRSECGMPGAICGILKAPMDIIADKLRGYLGLLEDLQTQPQKVLAACEAIAPHLLHVALGGADPSRQTPVGLWMHRGCVPFVSPQTFNSIYWPTLKPIIEELWRHNIQTLFYAEGSWDHHLESFAELPEQSIVYHVDQGDIFKASKALGHKFCLSGGLSNTLLGYGTPQQVRDRCKAIIDGVARDGGYVMDASAIVQNDAKVENVRAMTDFVRDYGVYSGSSPASRPERYFASPFGKERFDGVTRSRVKPGVCYPWEQKVRELPPIEGKPELVRRVWEDIDAWGNMYIWQLLESF